MVEWLSYIASRHLPQGRKGDHFEGDWRLLQPLKYYLCDSCNRLKSDHLGGQKGAKFMHVSRAYCCNPHCNINYYLPKMISLLRLYNRGLCCRVCLQEEIQRTSLPLISLLLQVLASPTVQIQMDGTRYTVTLNEFKLFHNIDRSLYIVLTRDLARNPLESLYILGLWMWLESRGFSNFISKILAIPPFLINELADEAVACLKCLNIQFPFSSEATEIPLTHSLAEKDISLQFFYEKRVTAFEEIQSLVNRVCVPSLSDIMERASRGGFGESSTQRQMAAPPSVDDSLAHSFFSMRIGSEDPAPSRGRARTNERTMFMTFSKGYPVSESEVRQFFTMLFGNCIESLQMQEVGPNEQALYAKIVFLRSSFIRSILNGASKAKFNINGKHVWMRKFVPKDE